MIERERDGRRRGEEMEGWICLSPKCSALGMLWLQIFKHKENIEKITTALSSLNNY